VRPIPLVALTVLALANASCQAGERGPAPPPPVPAEVARGVKLTKVIDGLDEPVALTYAPGDPAGRLFVVEKVGRIRILAGGRLQPASAPFLDLRDRVSGWTEQGLLGLAFHPDYARTRRFYVNFTDRDGNTRVLELQARADDPDHADPGAARELLRVAQPYRNHNGGDLVFGPDGKLYVGLGDGGSAGDPYGHGQRDATLLAKLVRLDVDAGRDGGARPRPVVVAKGLRNPWRYAFDRATGDLWIADVGQDRWEEIDVLPAAALAAGGAPANFGWNVMEGRHCFRPARDCDAHGLVPPILEYGHDEGCSITGGAVYRGHALPALAGAYFYADYCTALLRSVRWDPARGVHDSWDWRAALDPGSHLTQLSSFGEDVQGELYLLSLAGAVYRLDPR
jgi:glucose/arabinose dehydrogenase